MVILVTGAAGRLGVEFVKLTTTSGHVVRAFDLPNVHWEDVEGFENLEIIRGGSKGGRCTGRP